MKFSLKKFQKDRNKSYERSKKGELDLINKSSSLPIHEEIQQKFKIYDSSNFDAIYHCIMRNKDVFEIPICRLPLVKRNKARFCNDCDLKFSSQVKL